MRNGVTKPSTLPSYHPCQAREDKMIYGQSQFTFLSFTTSHSLSMNESTMLNTTD